MDVEAEERETNPEENTRRRITTKTSMEESQMDDEGEDRVEFRSSTAPNTRRRIATKTSLGEIKCDGTTVAVTTTRVVGWHP